MTRRLTTRSYTSIALLWPLDEVSTNAVSAEAYTRRSRTQATHRAGVTTQWLTACGLARLRSARGVEANPAQRPVVEVERLVSHEVVVVRRDIDGRPGLLNAFGLIELAAPKPEAHPPRGEQHNARDAQQLRLHAVRDARVDGWIPCGEGGRWAPRLSQLQQ